MEPAVSPTPEPAVTPTPEPDEEPFAEPSPEPASDTELGLFEAPLEDLIEEPTQEQAGEPFEPTDEGGGPFRVDDVPDFTPEASDEPAWYQGILPELATEPSPAVEPQPEVEPAPFLDFSTDTPARPRGRTFPKAIPRPKVKGQAPKEDRRLAEDWIQGRKQGFMYVYINRNTGKRLYSRTPLFGKVPFITGKGSAAKSHTNITPKNKRPTVKKRSMGVVDVHYHGKVRFTKAIKRRK